MRYGDYPDDQPDPNPEGVEDKRYRRARAVSIACTITYTVTGVFAAVLALRIILVVGEANMGNGFASFIDGWASAVNFGLDGLFTPGSAKAAVLLNDGLAALLWLGIGALVVYLLRKLFLPGPEQYVRYRRVTR